MIQKNDFVEIEYTGKTTDEGFIFDTTNEKIAKENRISEEHAIYGPIVICVGQNQILAGLDKNIPGKEVGVDYEIELSSEDAFGKKSAKLIQLIPARKFREQEVIPQPGLTVNIDGMNGIIKTASGGRILVDFNHPLSGKSVKYNLKVLRKVEDDKEKLIGFLKLTLGIKDLLVNLSDGKAEVILKVELPKEVVLELTQKVTSLIPAIKEVLFKKEDLKKAVPEKESTKK
jgi:FKBP-type peptidyl-prolyl cis-trans isomerase 2